MRGGAEYIPQIILNLTVPKDDNTEPEMRRMIQIINGYVEGIEFHRQSKSVSLDDCVSFPVTVRLMFGPSTLEVSYVGLVELMAREICQVLQTTFTSEHYQVSWSVQFTSVDSPTYTAAKI